MEVEEVLKDLETIKALVEWNFPLDYQISLSEAIRLIKEAYGNG